MSHTVTTLHKENLHMKHPGHMEAFRRTSDLIIRLKSFGNAEQHEKTLEKAVYELQLRGFDVELLRTLRHDGG